MQVQTHFADRYTYNSVYWTQQALSLSYYVKRNILPYTAERKYMYMYPRERLDNEHSVHMPCKSTHYRFFKQLKSNLDFFFNLKTKTNEFTVCTVYTYI